MLKPWLSTGQFGKNHLGDKDEFLPTNHGFDEFFGNLYHLNAEEEPELPDYPVDPEFRKKYGPRGVIHSFALPNGKQKIEDTGPLTKKRMETIDATSCTGAESRKEVQAGKPFFVWGEFPHMPSGRTQKPERWARQGAGGPYHDVMIDHDKNVGTVLKKIDDLALQTTRLSFTATDNGHI